MVRSPKEDYFVEIFVISFGLLNGVFAKAGVDPEGFDYWCDTLLG